MAHRSFIVAGVVTAVPLLGSDDLDATAAFYRRLGFTNKGAPHDEWDYLIIEYGGSEFHFVGPMMGERTPGSCWVYADDVERVYEEWKAGAGDSARFTPLAHTNFGMRAFTMFDPFGNEIRVGQPAG
jgi:catechol 2,3-dioxygenase-like lactoylglutathione lyase family enzyme